MRRIWWMVFTLALVTGGVWAVRAEQATTAQEGATTRLDGVKDVVVLKELMATYEAVPFAHRKHAEMAETGDGCKTCHHRDPAAATMPASTTQKAAETATVGNGHSSHESTTAAGRQAWQGEAAATPACKTCHPVDGDGVGIEVPSLKGAYHRQCLNCHREWMEANACAACHAVRAGAATGPATTMASRDDIVGRMHKPMVPPKDTVLTARYLPADGRKVSFGHDRHVKGYGAACASCHQKGNCSACHATGNGKANGPAPRGAATEQAVATVMKGGATWREAHRPCGSCHEGDRCKSCHYEEGKEAPPTFEHAVTGQRLDKDHAGLACVKCHAEARMKRIDADQTTCGGAECHRRKIAWPADRPGARLTVAAVTTRASEATTTTAPATTRPVIIKIRRGGS